MTVSERGTEGDFSNPVVARRLCIDLIPTTISSLHGDSSMAMGPFPAEIVFDILLQTDYKCIVRSRLVRGSLLTEQIY